MLLKLSFSNVDHCLPFVLSLLLWPLSFGMLVCVTQMFVFGLSLCLLGLKLSIYLVRILYFVAFWNLITLYQSNQTHSTTCQDYMSCKYQTPSSFPCCNLQHMSMLIQWFFFIFNDAMWDVIMKRKLKTWWSMISSISTKQYLWP